MAGVTACKRLQYNQNIPYLTWLCDLLVYSDMSSFAGSRGEPSWYVSVSGRL